MMPETGVPLVASGDLEHMNRKMRLFFFAFLLSAILFPAGCRAQDIYAAQNDDVISAVARYTVQPEDTLYEIARGFDVGILELMLANPGVDPWVPRAGTVLTLPMMHVLPVRREGIVINLSELR